MTGKAKTAYQRRLTVCDNWVQQPDNIARLKAAGAGKVTMIAIGSVLRLLVSTTSEASGCSQQSIDQIAAVTMMSPDMARRALKALETAGAVVTVYGGRKGINGTGRPAGRKVLFLAGDNLPENAIGVQSDGYRRAVDGLSACSQLHGTTEYITTEYITTAENVSAENETEKGKGAPSEPDWSSLVVSAITQQIVTEASGIDNPDGFRHYTLMKVRKAVYAVETGYGAGIRQITPKDYDWSSLVAVVKCRLSGEAVSRATSDALQKAADTALTS